MKKLVVASGNPGKLAEIRALLVPLDVEVVSQGELGIADAEEPHCTFLENALAKARHASAASGLPALADDSGICVDALGGDPGVNSAYYAGIDGSREERDARNNAKLLAALAQEPVKTAHYVCVMVLVRHAEDPRPLVAEGSWRGEIVAVARGANGFGYDPLFLLREHGRTAAELDPAEKNRVSHRGRALQRLISRLREEGLMPAADTVAVAAVTLSRPGEIRLEALPPLALYVHMPWCVRKCPYCDFNSHEKKGDLPEEAYCAALVSDLEHALPWIWGRRVSSIFFGGGTPSLFSARSLNQLISDIRSRITVAADAEITLEANPGTFEAQKFRDFRAAGINRLSIGVQSFNDAHLKALGRIHSADEARRAIGIAQANFDNINLDLMYGLPEQSLGEARADIEEGIRHGTTHLSAYQLTLEPNTVFYSHPPKLPEHDAAATMQEGAEALLAAAGFEHYETSAFAKPGLRSRHNENYWKFGDYLGLGAGAHGKISFPDRIERHARAKQPREYMAMASEGKSIVEQRTLTRGELPFEFMLNALRLIEGVPVALFRERTGLEISAIEAALAKGEALGLLERDWQNLRPSARGQRFLNELLELFLD